MKKVKRYIILGLIYITLFTLGFYVLESLESKKVYPFEHVQVGMYSSIKIGFIFFLLVYLPMTIITDFLPKRRLDKVLLSVTKVLLFSVVGVIIGNFIFSIVYPEWVVLDLVGVVLNRETSLFIFGLIGFIYSLGNFIKFKERVIH